jgi:hypothetical protein
MVEIKVAQDKLQTSRLRFREHEDEWNQQKKDLAQLKRDKRAIDEKLKSKKPAAQAGGGSPKKAKNTRLAAKAGGGPAKKTKPNDGGGWGGYDSAATNARTLVQAFFVTNVIQGSGNIGSFSATGAKKGAMTAVGKGKGKGKK